jgi:hypothetical protein
VIARGSTNPVDELASVIVDTRSRLQTTELVAHKHNAADTTEGWDTWTPVIVQGVTPTVTVQNALYFRSGRLVVARMFLTVTSAGTGGSVITSTLPVASSSAYTVGAVIGMGNIYDASINTDHPCWARWATSTTVNFLGTTGTLGPILITLANADQITFTVTYEAAS